MSVETIKLFSPNSNSEIIHIKLQDGSVSEFECEFSRVHGECNFLYILPEGKTTKLLRSGGELILVDLQGNEYLASDVEFHSTPSL